MLSFQHALAIHIAVLVHQLVDASLQQYMLGLASSQISAILTMGGSMITGYNQLPVLGLASWSLSCTCPSS